MRRGRHEHGRVRNGLTGPWGVKIGNDGKCYVTSLGTPGSVLRFNADGTFDQIFATVATPLDLIQNSKSNWYVSDLYTKSVLEFNGAGSQQGLFASAGGLAFPRGLAFAPDDGSLLVGNFAGVVTGPTNYYGSGVLKFDRKTGSFKSVFFSGGFLNQPTAIAFV